MWGAYKVARTSIFIGTPSIFESLYTHTNRIKTFGLHLN